MSALQANAIIRKPVLRVEASLREFVREDVPDALSILGIHWLAVAQSANNRDRLRRSPCDDLLQSLVVLGSQSSHVTSRMIVTGSSSTSSTSK